MLILPLAALLVACGTRHAAVDRVSASTTSTRPVATTTSIPAAGTSTTIVSTTVAPSAARTAPGEPCTSCATAPPPTPSTLPTPQPAHATDFTGTFSHYGNICDPCTRDFGQVEKRFELLIRNATDHPIDLSTAAPVRVAIVCATDMPPDGRPVEPLGEYTYTISSVFVEANPSEPGPGVYAKPGTSLAPGTAAANEDTTSYDFFEDPPGTVTCEGAIVATSDGTWSERSLTVVAPLANFQTYSFRLLGPPVTTPSTAHTTTPTS